MKVHVGFDNLINGIGCASGGWEREKTKKPNLSVANTWLLIRTQSRDRTGMEVNPLVFETSASTYSAIWANLFLISAAKVELFLYIPNVLAYFFAKRRYFCCYAYCIRYFVRKSKARIYMVMVSCLCFPESRLTRT